MTTLTEEQIKEDLLEASTEDMQEDGIKIDGKGE